jgi:5-dehydro-2-deoxygluconokinase
VNLLPVADTQASNFPEVVVMGRAGVDLYPTESERPLAKVATFRRFLGGSPSNVAVGVSRLGPSVMMLTTVADDAFGAFIIAEFERLGVDSSHIRTTPHAHTTLAFCEIFPPDNFPLHFFRSERTPDSFFHPDELPLEAISQAKILWVTLSGLSAEPSAAAHFAALHRRNRQAYTILDLDYRPAFWATREDATRSGLQALEYCDVVIANQEECALVLSESDPHRAAERILDSGASLAIIKRGPLGVLVATQSETLEFPSFPVTVVNGLGAGDAFGAAVCFGLLNDLPLEKMVRYANAAGAIVASRLECSTAMPTKGEIVALAESSE